MDPGHPSASSSRSRRTDVGSGRKKSAPKFEFSDNQKSDMKEVFDLFDTECRGSIDTKEVKVALSALGCVPKKGEFKRMIDAVDKERTGRISFNDFVQLMTMKMREKDSTEEMLNAFRLFDADGTGKISFGDLKRVASDLGELLTDEELHEMLDVADVDNDGEVSQDDFVCLMKKLSL